MALIAKREVAKGDPGGHRGPMAAMTKIQSAATISSDPPSRAASPMRSSDHGTACAGCGVEGA
ncbi:hypothetical protein GCM10022626_16670 [[Pseudomonas] carboxydohydrogena]